MGQIDKLTPKLTDGRTTISVLQLCNAQSAIVQRNEDCAAQSAIVQCNDPEAVHATNFFRPFPGGQSKYFWCTSQISNKQIILFFNSRQNTLSTAGPNWKTIIGF